MATLAKLCVAVAVIAVIAGIVFKCAGLNLNGYFPTYPVKPGSFLNFADTVLLFSIAFLLMAKKED